jgi:hypothetical protein
MVAVTPAAEQGSCCQPLRAPVKRQRLKNPGSVTWRHPRLSAPEIQCRGRARMVHSRLVAHAIEMLFDDQADAAVRSLWRTLSGAGLPSLATLTHRRHRPHVSLAVCESLDGADLARLTPAPGGSRR